MPENFADQLLKAIAKVRGDAQLAEKTRKALAIAVALIDEQLKPTENGEIAPDKHA